jgi:PPOX class probable F420-dependent enzyme
MPVAPVPPDVDAFVRKPNQGVVATVLPDGSPHLAVTWYDVEDDGRIVMSMDEDRLRLRNMKRDPRIALTAIDNDNWYWQVTLLGRVVALEEDEGLAVIDRLSRRYTGSDYPDRNRARWTAWMEVDRWHGWDPVRFDRWQTGASQPPV